MGCMRLIALALSFMLVLPSSSLAAAQQAPSSGASYAPPMTRRERNLSERDRIAHEGLPARDRTNWALMAPGIGLLLGGWALGWLTTIVWNLASTTCATYPGSGPGFISFPEVRCSVAGPYGDGYWQMSIPIIGPWLTFLADDTYRGDDIAFPIAMGIMQPIGLGLVIAAILSPDHVPARAPTAGQVDVRVGLSSLQLDVHF